jgi:quercetin dioxygenase-like cupin family protein
MTTTAQKQESARPTSDLSTRKAPAIKHQPKDTGGAYCLLEVSLAPGIGVPRHTHTREDETYYVTAGELEVMVGEKIFVLKPGDSLMAPRGIPHQLRNSGNTSNHCLLVFSPSGFEEFVMATAIPAPDNAVAPTEPQLQSKGLSIAIQNVHNLATEFGIHFGPADARIGSNVE